jgi:hypothetical protein
LRFLDGFNFFKGTNLLPTSSGKQLISNELRFYDLNILKPIEEKDGVLQQIEEFKLKNYIGLSKHFGKSLGF